MRSPAPAPRWTGDAWVLLRRGEAPGGLVAGGPGYGGSQAGAVLRFRLLPQDRHRPFAYFRIDGSIGGKQGYRTAALGLGGRPLPAIPVAVLGEGRVVEQGQGRTLRPAVMAVTELAPARLRFGIEAEIYGQAGYVGGARGTGFYDVQLTAERPVASFGPLDLRLGGGAWAGGQRGVRRVDAGPRLAIRTEVAGKPVRLSGDWRFRLSGNARPGSGPAVTLSAGF